MERLTLIHKIFQNSGFLQIAPKTYLLSAKMHRAFATARTPGVCARLLCAL